MNLSTHPRRIVSIFILALCVTLSAPVYAAYQSRFDVITFRPAVDSGEYFTVYSSQNLKAWQGDLGFYFDYANRPLQFKGTGGAVGRQSVIDHLFTFNMFGALGFTDWFEIGINIPVVLYNAYFTDNVAATEDHGGGMGDIFMMMKFRIVDSEGGPAGFSIMPFFTLPSGDVVRYTGNGHFKGGVMLIADFFPHKRFSIALNLGGEFRDDVQRHGVRIDEQFIYGIAGNIKFTKNWHGIIEAYGRTTFRNFFSRASSSPFEAGGGIRYLFGDSGFGLDAGVTAGIVDGVGSPRIRGFVGLKWTSPIAQECPACPPPAPPPDPRIKGDRIVIWGKIFFDTDKATIKPMSHPVLDDVVDVMQKNPQVALVEVQGHCDRRGGDAYNMKLSQRRAESVVNYLVSKGVSASRLTSKGYGWHKPIADNNTKEGMSQNRRVEFHILQRN